MFHMAMLLVLTIVQLFKHNMDKVFSDDFSNFDSRMTFKKLNELIPDHNYLSMLINNISSTFNLIMPLSKLPSKVNFIDVIQNVNLERLANNPVNINHDDILKILENS